MNTATATPASSTVFVVTLRAMPSEVPPIIRLRTALKALLRQHGLRSAISTADEAGAVSKETQGTSTGAPPIRAGN
jgi:hypothetical protein